MGALNGWKPMYHGEDGKKPLITILCDTIKEQKAEIVRLEHRLAAAGETPGNKSHDDLQEGSSSYISSETEDDNYYYDGTTGPNVSDDDIWSEKFRSEVKTWVDTHWESLRESLSNPRGWKSKDKAVN